MQALGARGARRRACVGARARAQVVAGRWASELCRRAGRAGRAAGGCWAGVRQQRGGRAGRAGNGRQARGQALRGHAGACGWAHGARRARPAWAWPGPWMGAQAGPAGPVLVHCAPGSVLARFLDPVRLGIFLSHQMNTVHCKINFRNFFFFIKFK